MRTGLSFGAIALCVLACTAANTPSALQDGQVGTAPCMVGVYGPSEAFLVLTRRDSTFHYAFSDGRFGEVSADGRIACHDGAVSIDGAKVWQRRAMRVTDTQFESAGVRLAGQLLEAPHAGPDTPLVALAHGSEERGWIEAASYPYQLVGRGVSVFVYDKRGTGRSAGRYSQNFPELADDLVAAAREAKRLAAGRYGRFGLLGFSQGGWIAPLAAARADAAFIGIGYGLVVDILEEDASQVELELRAAGFGDDVIAKAKEITDVTARLAVSGYADGLADLDLLRARYGNEAWFSQIKGGFSGVILGLSTDDLRDHGIPMFDRLNIDWSIKPMAVLRQVDVPQLWVLAADDREAPSQTTRDRLRVLRSSGKDIAIVMFPNTDHGMREYQQASDGSRQYTRVTNYYYDLLADWSKGELQPSYGASDPL